MDADLWDTLLTTGGEENQLDDYDRSDPHVLDVANDLFDEFRTSNGEPFEGDDDDLDDDLDSVALVPEGDDADEGDDSHRDLPPESVETSSTSTPIVSNHGYQARSGRVSRRQPVYRPTLSNAKRYRDTDPVLMAATARPAPDHAPAERCEPCVQLCCQAGGNPNPG